MDSYQGQGQYYQQNLSQQPGNYGNLINQAPATNFQDQFQGQSYGQGGNQAFQNQNFNGNFNQNVQNDQSFQKNYQNNSVKTQMGQYNNDNFQQGRSQGVGLMQEPQDNFMGRNISIQRSSYNQESNFNSIKQESLPGNYPGSNQNRFSNNQEFGNQSFQQYNQGNLSGGRSWEDHQPSSQSGSMFNDQRPGQGFQGQNVKNEFGGGSNNFGGTGNNFQTGGAQQLFDQNQNDFGSSDLSRGNFNQQRIPENQFQDSARKNYGQDTFGGVGGGRQDSMGMGMRGGGRQVQIKSERGPNQGQMQQQQWQQQPPQRQIKGQMQQPGSMGAGQEEVKMSEFDSHLTLEVLRNGTELRSMQATQKTEGAAYMWSGARGTHGVVAPAFTFFEVRITEHLEISDSISQGAPSWAKGHNHLCRIGWSTAESTLFLGEDSEGFGYGGTGKKSVGNKYSDYGEKYTQGDVIGCFLDTKSGMIIYTKNGRDLGPAFDIPRNLKKPLFPHVLLKNIVCEVNFGPQPWSPIPDALRLFQPLAELPPQDLSAGPRPPPASQCQVIMMIGLPGCGKTTWVDKFVEENKDITKFDVLGTNAIIDQMKVPGLRRKRAYHERWDELIKLSTGVFNELMNRRAPKNPRHYIIDQTNVYQSARRRKLRPFQQAGFRTKGVVIINTEEELARRTEQREREEGKMVPPEAVDNMRVNFVLPGHNEFDEIIYVEESREFGEMMLRETVPAARERMRASGGGDGGPHRGGGGRGGFGGGRGGGRGGRGKGDFDSRGDRGNKRQFSGGQSDDRQQRQRRDDYNSRGRGGGRDRDNSRGGGGGGGYGGGMPQDQYQQQQMMMGAGGGGMGMGGGGGGMMPQQQMMMGNQQPMGMMQEGMMQQGGQFGFQQQMPGQQQFGNQYGGRQQW
mmetsp:Transcript_4/g.9  ORF Transcript_4/g.9 Transcript_4/m.9 type:complete len:903 (-) Transcript_4:274-2982(-)